MTHKLTLATFLTGVLLGLGCNGDVPDTPDSARAEPVVTSPSPESTGDAVEAPPTADADTQTPAPADSKPGEAPAANAPRANNQGNQPRTNQGGGGGNNPNRAQGGGGGGFRGGGGMISLAMREDVRKEIGVTDEQVEKLRAKSRELMPQPGADGQRPNVDMQELTKKMEAAVKSILTPAQVTRLGQLQLQREGPTAMARKEVADKVGLPEATRAKIQGLVEANAAKAREQGASRPENQEEAQKRMAEMRASREKLQSDILAQLSAEQKAKWESLLGKTFTFQQGGGGGGAGRPIAPRD